MLPRHAHYFSRRRFSQLMAVSTGSVMLTSVGEIKYAEAAFSPPEYRAVCQRNTSIDINLFDVIDATFNTRLQSVMISFTMPPHGVTTVVNYDPYNFTIRFTPDQDWTGTTDFDFNFLHYGTPTVIRVIIEVPGPGTAYAWTHTFPNAAGVDSSKVKLWKIGSAIPTHNVGDIILGVGPSSAITSGGISGQFKGPLVLVGLTMKPTGILAADYSTNAAPVLGTPSLFQPTFTSDARSHWTWEGRNWPFFFLANIYVDYKANACSFGDFIRARMLGVQTNDTNGAFRGPKAIVIQNKIYMNKGPHYVSETTNPDENGHSDGVQSLGGIPIYRAADCYFAWCGGQLYFSGREAEICGWPRSTRWEMRNVAMDHQAFWNTNVRAHSLNTNAQFIKAYEEAADAYELYDYNVGKYMAVNFATQCYVRGRFAATDMTNIKKYIGGNGGITGVDANGNWQFNGLVKGNHTYPAYAGQVRYIPPTGTLPTTCDPAQTGSSFRITSVDQFMDIIRA